MNHNIRMIDEVSESLGEMTEKVVFLGGAVTSLLLTDTALSDIRPTKDVDVIVEAASYNEYSKLEELLRKKGFKQKIGSQFPICRWIIGNILVDFMPTDSKILGFSNIWYKDAVRNYTIETMPSGKEVKIVSPPYFIGTKIEAFLGRGENDFIMSHDIEDIITVVDGRKELPAEIKRTHKKLRQYIQKYLAEFEKNNQFRDAIAGYLPTDPESQKRFSTIIDSIQTIIAEKSL